MSGHWAEYAEGRGVFDDVRYRVCLKCHKVTRHREYSPLIHNGRKP